MAGDKQHLFAAVELLEESLALLARMDVPKCSRGSARVLSIRLRKARDLLKSELRRPEPSWSRIIASILDVVRRVGEMLIDNIQYKFGPHRCGHGAIVDLGLALKYYRVLAGLKQKEVARKAGVSASYLSLVESGRRTATLNLIDRLATALGVPVELLLIEARQHQGGLSLDQQALFDRAKRLLSEAVMMRRDYAGGAPERQKKHPAAAEREKPQASRPEAARAIGNARRARRRSRAPVRARSPAQEGRRSKR